MELNAKDCVLSTVGTTTSDPAVINGRQEAYGLNRGDKVMFTNEHGVTFGPYTVIGFCEPEKRIHNYTDLYTGERKSEERICHRTVYINSDSYWFPVEPGSLSKI